MADKAQLEKALVAAHEAGDVEAAKMIARQLKGQPKGTPLAAAGEIAAMVGTSMLAEPVAGLAGMAVTATDGAEAGVETINAVREAGTYRPRTETANRWLGNIDEAYNAPLPIVNQSLRQGVEGATNFFADRGADLLSPFGLQGEALGAAGGETALTALGMATGAKAANKMIPEQTRPIRVDPRVESIQRGDAEMASKTIDEKGRVRTSKPGKKAQYQGMEPGMVAAVRSVNKETRQALRKMVDIVEIGRKNRREGATLYPSQVAGESIGARVHHVSEVNRQAGRELDHAARNLLKNQPVDYEPAVNKFIDELADLDIGFNQQTLKLDFKGSRIQGLGANESAIKRVVEWMKNAKSTDALGVHKLKRYLDENIDWERSAEGATASVQRLLKTFRHDLKTLLDDIPQYAKANKKYSETRQVLDDFQEAVGKRTDTSNARQLGIESRKILSNYRSGTTQLDGIEALSEVAKKYGGKFKDDVVMEVLFYTELQRLFPETFRTTFKAEIEKGVEAATRGKQGLQEAALEKGVELIAGKKGEEELLAALKSLLDETLPKSE